VRAKIVYPYVLFYEHSADTVIVLRILHGHRDITAEMLARSRGVAPPRRG
jgi:plasmid stabilization system protein ParE